MPLSYPNSPVRYPYPASASVYSFTPPNPTLGEWLTYNWPAGFQGKINVIRFRLVTDSNSGNRNVVLRFNGGTKQWFVAPQTLINQSASSTYYYSFIRGLPAQCNYSNEYSIPFPDADVREDDELHIDVENIQDGDQIQQIYISATFTTYIIE